jgi:hypothetical protein
MRAGVIATVASLLVLACGPEPEPRAASPTARSPSPSPSPEPDYCEYAPELRSILQDVEAGTELPRDLIDALGEARDTIEEAAEYSLVTARESIRSVADAIGRLRVEIADAGADYATDFPVQAGRLTVEISMDTAALESRCP